jgi:hypothetical protein
MNFPVVLSVTKEGVCLSWYLSVLFLLIVPGGASVADWTGLEHVDWSRAPQTLPIILLALVYHDLTPGTLSH